MAKTFDLVFDGRVNGDAVNDLPSKKGLYCIRTTVVGTDKRYYPTLQYIGKADDLLNRLSSGKDDGLNGALQIAKKTPGTFVTIAFALFSGTEDDLLRVESCLIFCTNPPLNDQSTEGFHYEETTVNISGQYASVFKSKYVAEKTEK